MPLPMPPLIPCRNRMLALLVACACACVGAFAQEPAATPATPATSAGELPTRAHIQQQRQAVQAQLQQQEAACRQRFAVEDCLRKARSAARAQDNLLWRQELELDEAERRDRAAQRLRAIEERGGSGSQEPPAAAPAGRLPPPGEAGGHEAEAQLRARQASERASQARQRQQAHEAAQQQRAQQQAERLEQSRQRYEARQQKARERRAEHERQRAQDAAEGRPAARPLPPPQ